MVSLLQDCRGRLTPEHAALVFFAGVPIQNVGYQYLHAYLLFLLAAAGLLSRYLRDHLRQDLFFAGAAVGFAFLFRMYLTGAAAAALFATVLLEARSRNRPWGETRRLLTIYCLGCLVVVAGASIWLSEILPDMWHAVTVDSISHGVTRRPIYGHSIVESWTEFTECLDRLWQNPGRIGTYFYVVFAASDHLTTGLTLGLPFLAALLWGYRRRMGVKASDHADRMVLFFLLWGSLTFIRAFIRGGSPWVLSQAVTPLYFVLVLVLRPVTARWRATRTIGAGMVAISAIVAAVGIGQRAATVTVSQLLTLRNANYGVSAPYGTVIFKDQKRADELRELLAIVLENTAEKEHIFVIPWNAPALYALTRRCSPTYYDSTIDLFRRPTEEKQRRVCDALLEKNTRLIIGRADLGVDVAYTGPIAFHFPPRCVGETYLRTARASSPAE
jgi:hypothetical protein